MRQCQSRQRWWDESTKGRRKYRQIANIWVWHKHRFGLDEYGGIPEDSKVDDVLLSKVRNGEEESETTIEPSRELGKLTWQDAVIEGELIYGFIFSRKNIGGVAIAGKKEESWKE